MTQDASSSSSSFGDRIFTNYVNERLLDVSISFLNNDPDNINIDFKCRCLTPCEILNSRLLIL